MIFSFTAAVSLADMPSVISTENAPLPNSSFRISCPCIVSMSFGRYVRRS